MAKGYNGRGMRGMGGGMNMNMVRQAQKMQADMQRMQEELENKQYRARTGGGAVEVTVNGNKEITNLKIDKAVVDPDDVEMLQDLVMAAVNEGLRTASDTMEREMGKLTGGINMPGLF